MTTTNTRLLIGGACASLMLLAASPVMAQTARVILRDSTLMHEMRQIPFPVDGAVLADRKVSFQWPLPDAWNSPDDPLDGFAGTKMPPKSQLVYKVRYSQDPNFKTGVTEHQTIWPMYNPDTDLAPGKWYWQYGYVRNGNTHWSRTVRLTVADSKWKFEPPSFAALMENLPAEHPRVWVEKSGWDSFIARAKTQKEYRWYVERAEQVLKVPMKGIDDIATAKLAELKNDVQRKAYITRESRRIIDAEEQNANVLVYAYLLTKDERYSREATRRIISMADWNKSDRVAGDFNESTVVSLASMAYDSFHDLLTADERKALLKSISDGAGSMYAKYNNHLENHIADNHVWQMTLRILTMAAFATCGELPEARTWAEYCYNMWVARMPGLNTDGGWHNGDSYFTVNTRTLIEVPLFYSRLSGYDFFQDPWYRRNILYTIYEQPPFSKSGGNGSSHQKVLQPSAVRVGYLDALARLTGDTYAADFVRRTLAEKPQYLKKSFLAKSGDLAWFRLQCDKPLPKGDGIASLPHGHVMPESGLAAFDTDWNDYRDNAMWTFRSSPYGSTSHALANQNAFNTFYGGKSLFYSSGHHISFTDRHSVYCHRATRAHNTILVDGMGQRIGTEGYGWIPRYYVGKDVGYVLGDASNAYGEVVSTLWLERGRESELAYTPENGWDKNHLKTYRRHIVDLGATGLIFIYDELEADKPVAWSYLLHSVINPLTEDKEGKAVHVRATNGVGASDAWIYAPTQLATSVTDQFFVPATNWLRADAKGHFAPNPNHWHFTATSPKSQYYHFATIVDTHADADKARAPKVDKDGTMHVGDWTIKLNIKADGKGYFEASNKRTGASVALTDRGTIVKDNGTTQTLVDSLPQLEI